MIDKKYIELINEDIDGLIIQNEKEDLRNFLKDNDEAQQYYDEMIQTAQLLGKVNNINPSPNLKKRVLNSIDYSRYKKVRKESFIKSFIPRKLLQPKPRLAFAFALGIVVGVFLYSMLFTKNFQHESINSKDVYGTIGVAEEVGDKIKIELLEIDGSISLSRINDLFSFDNSLNSAQKFLLQFQYNPNQIKFYDFTPLNTESYSIKKGSDYFQTFCSGDNKFTVNFQLVSQENSHITIKLLQSGKLLFDEKIELFRKK